MQIFRSPFTSMRLIGLLTAINLGIAGSALPARSQSVSPANAIAPTQPTQILFNAPRPPRQGTPTGRSQGGASRGDCQNYEALTAIVPATEGVVWGMTAQEHPTLWFYLPQALTAETSIEFVLQDNTDQYLYQASFTAPDTQAGLIQITVPSTTPSLEPNKLYSWTLAVYCNPDEPSESVFVTGTLERSTIDASLQNQLNAATPLEQAKLYAANGIWHDALNTLAVQYQTQTDNAQIVTAWSELLQQTNLANFTTTPFSACCTP